MLVGLDNFNYTSDTTNASILAITLYLFLSSHIRFEVQCLGYPLTNYSAPYDKQLALKVRQHIGVIFCEIFLSLCQFCSHLNQIQYQDVSYIPFNVC